MAGNTSNVIPVPYQGRSEEFHQNLFPTHFKRSKKIKQQWILAEVPEEHCVCGREAHLLGLKAQDGGRGTKEMPALSLHLTELPLLQ